ncbi:MAG: aldo/keto reductase [Deferribacteraceae bacterium]|jgi:diketogulonate reductase-like aldo/keto reductase|nr:aldo/keto reductase [Deferribacteraceae bacterium]
MDIKSTVKLNNGVEMPLLGFGVFRTKDGKETEDAVSWALEAGYIHIDTAKIYGNEKSVGAAIKNASIPREKIFVTTKLWNEDMRQHRQMAAFEESLKIMGLDYVDLYMIHWPVNFVESWKVMEEIYKSGRAKAIGISNFQPHHMDTLMKEAKVTPAVNQFECHPYLSQQPLVDYCKKLGIACEAYSPIGGQGSDLLSNAAVVKLAQKYSKTPAQVVLRWHLQRGIIAIPKSIKKERVVSNCQLYDFELSAADMDILFGLNINKRIGSDPDNFNF